MSGEYWRLNPPGQSDDPSRETAAELITTMSTGEGSFDAIVAHRCFMLFGCPELEPKAVARWMAERFMRPGTATQKPLGAHGKASAHASAPEQPSASPRRVPHDGYGFTPRP